MNYKCKGFDGCKGTCYFSNKIYNHVKDTRFYSCNKSIKSIIKNLTKEVKK